MLDCKCLVPATNPSRVCLMSAKRKRSYDVAMKLQAVDVAETTLKEAAARQFGVDSMEFIWRGRRALAERNKRQPRINAGPVLTPGKSHPGKNKCLGV